MDDLHHFYFVELVLTNHTAGIPATATGMEEEIDLERLELLDRAEELARQMFEYPTEAHVEGELDPAGRFT
ncbi:hypothetical protein QWA_18407 [Alcaligenes faecalis subsp. faecalis NCIB 8687]|nr:hypothetical protein QWA_18407 [Alcaligenes faecalis subsp. faecalis NCIB 8687]